MRHIKLYTNKQGVIWAIFVKRQNKFYYVTRYRNIERFNRYLQLIIDNNMPVSIDRRESLYWVFDVREIYAR